MFRIPGGDNLFRHCVHPLSFSGKRFVAQKLIKLYSQPDGSFLASLTWARYLPTTEHVHAYGCRLALGMNAKLKEQPKFDSKARRVYCGAFLLKAKAVRALPNLAGLTEISSADVVHSVEQGEIAHTDLRIVLRPDADVEGTKTAIIDRLWQACSGPITHICDDDHDLESHPSVDLPVAPGGSYSDNRWRLTRFWHLVRFRICCWFWRTYLKKDTE